MRIEINDWPTAIVLIVVVVGVLFALMYSAARLAVVDAANVPKFSCLPEQDGDATRFTLLNTGTGSAFDVAVRPARDPRGEPLVRIALFGPAMTATWTSSRSVPASSAPQPGDPPATDQVVEWLTVEWRLEPSGSRRWTRIPVRIPRGIVAR